MTPKFDVRTFEHNVDPINTSWRLTCVLEKVARKYNSMFLLFVLHLWIVTRDHVNDNLQEFKHYFKIQKGRYWSEKQANLTD